MHVRVIWPPDKRDDSRPLTLENPRLRLFSGLPASTTQVSCLGAECGSEHILTRRILGVSHSNLLAYRLYGTPVCIFDPAVYSHAVYDDRNRHIYTQLPLLKRLHHAFK